MKKIVFTLIAFLSFNVIFAQQAKQTATTLNLKENKKATLLKIKERKDKNNTSTEKLTDLTSGKKYKVISTSKSEIIVPSNN